MKRSALALLAALTALDVLGGSSAASAFYGDDCEGYYRRCRGFVIPCMGSIPPTTPRSSAILSLPDRNMASSARATAPGTSRGAACVVNIAGVEAGAQHGRGV